MFSASPTQGGTKVVQSARLAREERALQKRRESAIVSIQAFVRGCVARRKVHRLWLEEIDRAIGYEDSDAKITNKKQAALTQPSAKKSATKVNDTTTSSDWQFKSFSSTTLTGTYGQLSLGKTSVANNQQSTPTSQQEKLSAKSDSAERGTVAPHEKDVSNRKEIKKSIETLYGTDIFELTRKFLFLIKLERDKWRFEQLCRIILENSNPEKNVKNSYGNLCINKRYTLTWCQQVKQLLRLCCRYLEILNPQEHHSGRMISVCLNMMIFFTDASSWKAAKKQPTLLVVLTQMSNSFSYDLYGQRSLQILAGLLSRRLSTSPPKGNDVMLLATFTMALRPRPAYGMKDKDVVEFVRHIFPVPGLMWHINKSASQGIVLCKQHGLLGKVLSLLSSERQCYNQGLFQKRHASSNTVIDTLCTVANLTQLAALDKEVLEERHMEFVLMMNQLLDYLVHCSCQEKSSSSTWHPVLGFFKSPENAQNQSMKYVKLQLEYFWNPSLVRAVYRDVLTLQSLHADDVMPTQAEQLVTKQVQKTKLSDRMASYLKKLSLSKSRTVFKPTGGRKLEYAEVKNTTLTCLMYKKCLSVVTKQLQLEMLTGLTFMDEVLCRLWRFICELGTSGGLKLFLSALTLPPAIAEPYFAVFTLFCDMTAHILSILDDVEFYEEQIPFHLEELVTISDFLRTFVFRVIWDQISPEKNNHMLGVFDSASTLLLMLHDRDARRPFTPIDHWLCRQVKASAIRSEIEKSTPRGMLVIDKIPFVIPHKDRVVLFRSLVAAEKETFDEECPAHITVRRSRLLEDGFEQLSTMESRMLKGTIRVKFINDLGLDEAGIDQDGVFKEFLEEIIKKVFNPDMNLFRVTTEEDGKLYPSPTSYLQDDHLKLLKFVGQMLGKAVYEGIVVDVPFATFFLRNLQQQHNMLYSPLDELPSLDAEFYKNLTWIKRYDGDMSDLDLTFTFEEDVLGRVETRELMPGGSAIPVTNQNRIAYIHKLAHYRLDTQIREQTRAFTAGFRSIIRTPWTSMFSAPELQRLISGDNVDLDLTDLKRNVTYYGGFHSSHRVVRWLWDILEKDYTPQQRAAFLKFVTSCSRPPILGFTYLQPQFSIRCVEVSDDDDTGDSVGTVLRGFFRISSKKQGGQKHRLPTASTCFNLLKLPNYPSKDILRDKLKQAIANNTGFELS